MRGKMVAAIAVVGLVATACSGGGGDPAGSEPRDFDPTGNPFSDDIVLASALSTFDECDDLLSYVTEHAQELVGPWGLNGGMVGYQAGGDDVATEESAADGDSLGAAPEQLSGRAAQSLQEGVDYSGTNVQEGGVDEPDSVKTDGEYLYLLRGQWLEIVDVRGAEPRVVSSTDLGGWSESMLLSGDRLLVNVYPEGGMHPLAGDRIWGGGGGATMALYDVSDRTSPELTDTLQLDGYVVSSRLVDGVARVVLRAEPVGLEFEYPQGNGLRAERQATERNKEIIASSTIDNWMPYYVHTNADGSQDEGSLLPCDRLHHPVDFAGLGTTTVLSLDLADGLSPAGSTGVIAGGETVYSSTDRLYVATNRWVNWELLTEAARITANDNYSTDLHAFDISDPDGARYIASGTVRGHVPNQWGMSEFDGVLRVATTEGSPWGWREDAPASESYVTTFSEEDGELVQLGQVGGLGKDEQIYAVRFMGEVGYVVTFRQTDPLYTLDLSDPANPEVLGELKILGYSAYLHPIDRGLILGVGQDADESGRTQGMQLSLFDVSDLANPERIHQVTLKDAFTEVEYNHHAFLHWPATGLTVIPFQTWSWDEESETESVDNGAVAYRLGLDSGFEDAGRLTHVPEEISDSSHPRYWDVAWQATIQRSIVIGDTLYTISELGIKGSDLDTLADESWLSLQSRN